MLVCLSIVVYLCPEREMQTQHHNVRSSQVFSLKTIMHHHHHYRKDSRTSHAVYKGMAVCIQYSTADTELIKSLPGSDPALGRSKTRTEIKAKVSSKVPPSCAVRISKAPSDFGSSPPTS